jgi:Rieske Fe-S protein
MTDQVGLSRRTVLTGVAAVGGTVVLAGCTAASDDAGTDGEAAASEAGGGALVATGEVPVGGGVIVADAKVVVTQPTEGEFKAFSSTCTHQGCQVSSVSTEAILCACHGSSFSLTDGAVLGGPATAPLPEVAVALDGDEVVLA